MAPGYSGTPLSRKLGIKAGTEVVAIAAPRGYRSWLDPLPQDVRFAAPLSANTDIVHVFATRRAELQATLVTARSLVKPEAAIWVSWPKKTSGMPTEVTEHVIRELALPLGYVDVKVCAVTDVWSGLKLVIRKALRAT
jgi:hypothetical protein